MNYEHVHNYIMILAFNFIAISRTYNKTMCCHLFPLQSVSSVFGLSITSVVETLLRTYHEQ